MHIFMTIVGRLLCCVHNIFSLFSFFFALNFYFVAIYHLKKRRNNISALPSNYNIDKGAFYL